MASNCFSRFEDVVVVQNIKTNLGSHPIHLKSPMLVQPSREGDVWSSNQAEIILTNQKWNRIKRFLLKLITQMLPKDSSTYFIKFLNLNVFKYQQSVFFYIWHDNVCFKPIFYASCGKFYPPINKRLSKTGWIWA